MASETAYDPSVDPNVQGVEAGGSDCGVAAGVAVTGTGRLPVLG
jgi:hypothetical protein